MGLIETRGGRSELPIASAEIQDEVELYARESGRHAKIHYVPTEIDIKSGEVLAGTWRVDMTLRPDDKRNVTYQEGRMDKPPVEEIWIHDPNPSPKGPLDRYKARNIQQMGASGVREFLERGNIHSGRGEFSSMDDVIRKTDELNENKKQKRYDEAEDRVRMRSRDRRRSRLKKVHGKSSFPFLSVAIDLLKPKKGVVKK